jgi:2-furoyl-CoA dehydrogenase 2Fe-2S iron sulfur subunit
MKTIGKDDRALLRLTLNGKPASGVAEPRMLLSDFLRTVLGATGTHVGCEHGVCGCCTVILNGVAARSCLTLAAQADGAKVETVESLAAPDRIQHASRLAVRLLHTGHPDVVHRFSSPRT